MKQEKKTIKERERDQIQVQQHIMRMRKWMRKQPAPKERLTRHNSDKDPACKTQCGTFEHVDCNVKNDTTNKR